MDSSAVTIAVGVQISGTPGLLCSEYIIGTFQSVRDKIVLIISISISLEALTHNSIGARGMGQVSDSGGLLLHQFIVCEIGISQRQQLN